VFTKPSFETFCHYVGALMLGEGRRTGASIARVTANAKSAGVYARLWSRARWSAEALLDHLWALLLRALPWPRDEQGRLIMWAAIDDSVAAKTGKKIPGLAYHFHHNAGKDQHAWPFLFGHCWVTLAVVWPTVTHALCFPLRAALYLRAKDCAPQRFPGKDRSGAGFAGRSALARADVFVRARRWRLCQPRAPAQVSAAETSGIRWARRQSSTLRSRTDGCLERELGGAGGFPRFRG
jgi:hypothetical protein